MDWKKYYNDNLCTAAEAVNLIKSGDRVVFTHAVSEPKILVDAMVENKDNYENVTISHMVSLAEGKYAQKEYSKHFHVENWFSSVNTRKAINEGFGEFVPVFFHEVPSYIRRGYFPIDVCLVSVTPPDDHGYCCLGVSSDYSIQAIKSAKVVLAEINDKVPTVYGDTFVHVSEITKFVETSRDLTTIPLPKIGEIEEAIGKHCATLVEDGSTLQLGIGSIPDAVLSQLKDKKDLGIHSEMISDGVVDLYEAGVINNSKKSIDKGKMIVTFLMGSQRLYDFADKNPMVEMRTVDYVNHPMVVAECSNMVAINACLEVDFLGQVVSDSIGTKQFSGVGGQVDFVRGCSMAKDGKAKAIIAMPSFTKKKDGTMLSKIVPYIAHGAAVTTSRQDVDYIVTEYGIAHLKGVSLKERARRLINIAHPDFRDELKQEFENRFKVKY